MSYVLPILSVTQFFKLNYTFLAKENASILENVGIILELV